MSIESLSQDDKAKLKEIVDQGVRVLQEVKDMNEALRDTTKAVGDELNIKSAIINKAIKMAFKLTENSSAIEEEREKVDDVEEILVLVGRK